MSMKENFKKYLKTYIVSSIVSLIIGIAIFLIIYFSNNMTMYSAINGASLSAVILLCLGGLMWVASEGFFDIFAYGFKQVGSFMFSKKPNENNNFSNYKEQNRVKRENKPKVFLPILLVGLLFLIVMIILRIIEVTM